MRGLIRATGGVVPIAVLSALLLLGLGLGMLLSWRQIQSGDACPVLGGVVPACHVATAAYLLMTLGVGLLPGGPRTRWRRALAGGLFGTGWLLATGLATLGSAMEFARGGVCPRGPGGVPMCYVSLGACVVFLLLYGWAIRSTQASQSVRG